MRRGGGQMSYHCFLEGANIQHYAFVEWAIILPCQLLGGRCPHMPFFILGEDVRGGGGEGNVRLTKYVIKLAKHLNFCAKWGGCKAQEGAQ